MSNVIYVNFYKYRRLTPEQRRSLAEFKAIYGTFDSWMQEFRSVCVGRIVEEYVDSFLDELSYGLLDDYYEYGKEPEAAFELALLMIADAHEGVPPAV